MGTLSYGNSGIVIHFDDRTLAHLQIAMMTKLRRREGFFLSWNDDPSIGDGRSSVWISSAIPLKFSFTSSLRIDINRDWLDKLTQSANSSIGLVLSDEPGRDTPAPTSAIATKLNREMGKNV